MDENHQDKTENKAPATKDKLWLPPLSPQDQKKLDRLKDRKNAKQLLISIAISAVLVGVIVYKGFRLNWPLELWISMPYWAWVLISLILLIGTVLLVLSTRIGYMERWTGFKGKTLWDWLDLAAKLAVPLILGIATLSFGILQTDLANQQRQQDQASALDQQRQATLVTYLDDMRDLLLNRGLLTSKKMMRSV